MIDDYITKLKEELIFINDTSEKAYSMKSKRAVLLMNFLYKISNKPFGRNRIFSKKTGIYPPCIIILSKNCL